MSRLLRGVALGAAILLAATACTNAAADGDGGTDGDSANASQDGGYGDLYYAVYEKTADQTYTSKLLRWDGTEDGEVETVLETRDTWLFHTATVSSDGAYAVYAEGHDDGKLKLMDLRSNETRDLLDFPKLADSCLTPAFAPGGSHELVVPKGESVTIHNADTGDAGDVFAIDTCMPRPAKAEGGDGLSVFYLDYDNGPDSGEIMFMKPNHETVDTGLGQQAAQFIGTDRLHEIAAVSPSGSQVCVDEFTLDTQGRDPYSRHGTCQVLFDVATGEIIKHFDGATFAVGYTGAGLMLRKDGELSYYPSADDLSEPTETISEPGELTEAQLIAVTDA